MSEMYKDAWNIFQKRGMLFIHLNIDCVLAKMMKYATEKLTNATVIGVSEQ